MGLYVQLWPVWLIVAVLMVNLLIALARAVSAKIDVGVSDTVAGLTAALLAIASVTNFVVCVVSALQGV